MRVLHDHVVAEFDTLPGSSQVAVVHGVFVEETHRGIGYGQRGQKARLDFLRDEMKYDCAICTVDMKNRKNIHILEKNGWIFSGRFKSRKTGHDVGIYIRGLGQTLQPMKSPKLNVEMPNYVGAESMGEDYV